MKALYHCRCGQDYPADNSRCPFCGTSSEHNCPVSPARSRSIYIVMALLLGGFGVHNFYAGRTLRGLLQACVSIAGYFLAPSYSLPVLLIWILFDIVTVTEAADGKVMQ